MHEPHLGQAAFGQRQVPRHGKWIVCPPHSPSERQSQREGYYVTEDERAEAQARASCPPCLWDYGKAAGAQRRADEAEVERRNAEERQNHLDADPKPGWIAEFRAQGYGPEAAEAMASKRRRENPPLRPEPKWWKAFDIKTEREEAERQPRRDAGEIGFCPACKGDVLLSQGIVLRHGFYRGGSVSWGAGGDTPATWVMCRGEGSQAI